eukprot:4835213-Pleurochrysis_carterae.AAC.1
MNRNTEIDRSVREGRDYTKLLPIEARACPPVLEPRVVPNLDDEEFGMEVGEVGQMLWCQSAGRWELGTLIGTRKKKLLVEVEGEEIAFDAKEVTQFEPSHAQDLPNMVHMHNLHEAPLLYLLQRRLKAGRIYTWAGDVLISLNPYAPIPELYELSPFITQPKPNASANAVLASAANASPHVYAVARRAYLTMLATKEAIALGAIAGTDGAHVDQSVLISGESGAGKTEASKHVIEFLTSASRLAKEARDKERESEREARAVGGGGAIGGGAVSGAESGEKGGAGVLGGVKVAHLQSMVTQPRRLQHPEGAGSGGSAGGGAHGAAQVSVEALLRDASPVLEAFGNAKTIRNDNSSRFGKYVCVEYDGHGGIVGSSTETYLLERSRVVDIGEGERNYHIFYQLLTHEETRTRWRLPDATGLDMLCHEGKVACVDGVSDVKEFASVVRALEVFGLRQAEQSAIWRVLAAVLLLGNVRFRVAGSGGDGGDGGGGEGEGGGNAGGATPRAAAHEGDAEVAEVVDEEALEAAAAAFGCE